MDFFEHQELARKNTRQLVVYFCLSIFAVFLAMYCAAVGLFHLLFAFADYGESPRYRSEWDPVLDLLLPLHDELGWLDPELFLTVGIGTAFTIFIGTSIKTFQMAEGGESVATLLGGRKVSPATSDPDEKRLQNVVEEMAIASGTAVPSIYLLENEKSINAFAAGNSIEDATIGVTKGCMKVLSRDELQGVIGHEFSHILHGDMKLNMRLASLTYGILFLAEAGSTLFQMPFRVIFYSGGGRKRDSFPIQLVIVVLAVGAILCVIGSVGGLCAKLIKSAISRQREFLADSAAVQYTRNPEGLSGALQKIGGLVFGSKLETPASGQASHFFFANGLSAQWFSSLATHPPLEDRIARIDPYFNGQFPKVHFPKEEQEEVTAREEMKRKMTHEQRQERAQSIIELAAVSQVMHALGNPDKHHVRYAEDLTNQLPDQLYEAAHELFGARALIYALLIDLENPTRQQQLDRLREKADPQVFHETLKLLDLVSEISVEFRLPAVDIAIPALRDLTPSQYDMFQSNVTALIEADQQIHLFEYCLSKVLSRHLNPQFEKQPPPLPKFRNLREVAPQINAVLSLLAYQEAETMEEANAAFHSGTQQLNLHQYDFQLLPYEECQLDVFDQSLNDLAGLSPSLKKNVLFAASSVVYANEIVSYQEAEILRALADTLGCPLPPFVRGS
ncbi:MAG: M48 family metallopeptidase [Verrucomicrobiota bacterium]